MDLKQWTKRKIMPHIKSEHGWLSSICDRMKRFVFKLLTCLDGPVALSKSRTPYRLVIAPPLPRRVSVLLRQCAGAPALSIVKIGERVRRFQKIAEGEEPHSPSVHAPISGTVTDICPVETLTGEYGNAIIITASYEEHERDEIESMVTGKATDWQRLSPEEILDAIAEAGIVEEDTSSVPLAAKISRAKSGKVELLIINALEVDRDLTRDNSVMFRYPEQVIEGIRIMMKTMNARETVVAMDKNMDEVITAMRKAASCFPEIKIRPMRPKPEYLYDKVLINSITGKKVTNDGDITIPEVIVSNLAAAFAVYRGVALGIPQTMEMVTVVGRGNCQIPIGMHLSDLEIAFPDKEFKTGYELIDGSMSRRPIVTCDAPLGKDIAGVVVPEMQFNGQS